MQRKQQDAAGCNRMQQDATGCRACRESNSMQRKQQAVTLIQQDASGTDGYRNMHYVEDKKNTVILYEYLYRRMQIAEGFNRILRKQQNETLGAR
jgi:hypothetical protein